MTTFARSKDGIHTTPCPSHEFYLTQLFLNPDSESRLWVCESGGSDSRSIVLIRGHSTSPVTIPLANNNAQFISQGTLRHRYFVASSRHSFKVTVVLLLHLARPSEKVEGWMRNGVRVRPVVGSAYKAHNSLAVQALNFISDVGVIGHKKAISIIAIKLSTTVALPRDVSF
ncbi:hypothetical protein BGW80DRAFT_1279126 [Lactifluus volemus]|nr:hypothetical protein BGW80DRAFT_1279126 [Lactifluus volemus]